MHPLTPYLEFLKYFVIDLTEELGHRHYTELQITGTALLSLTSQTSIPYSIVLSAQNWAYHSVLS